MKTPIADPLVAMINVPHKSKTAKIGNIQNFLRIFKNSQSSCRKSMAASKLIFHGIGEFMIFPRGPVTREIGIKVTVEGIMPQQFHD